MLFSQLFYENIFKMYHYNLCIYWQTSISCLKYVRHLGPRELEDHENAQGMLVNSSNLFKLISFPFSSSSSFSYSSFSSFFPFLMS